MRNQLKIIVTGFSVGLVLFLLEKSFRVISGGEVNLDLQLLHNLGLYILYSIPLSYVNGYFFDFLNRQEWSQNGKYRFGIGLLGSILITLITIFLIRLVHLVGFEGLTLEEFLKAENFQFYFIALIITLVVSLFFHAIHFYKMLQEKKVTEQKIIAGTASAKFESLKNQIDPHFLFNSLNVLTSLIEESPEIAQKFTSSLSKIYRYVLEQKDKELVDLEEEINFAVTYMKLLKMRFEGSISYEVPQDLPEDGSKVVPLSLQLLLENTVKHNVVSENKPLHIRIYKDFDYLVIENNLQKKEVFQSRRGVGLDNIVERYGFVTSRSVEIEETPAIFRVKIPVLTKQISVMETNMENKELSYQKAKERVKELKGFYGNLLSYCIVIPLLIFINYRTYWEFKWFWFPLLGWGTGLFVHWLSIFGYGANWEEKKIRQIMEKEENIANNWK